MVKSNKPPSSPFDRRQRQPRRGGLSLSTIVVVLTAIAAVGTGVSYWITGLSRTDAPTTTDAVRVKRRFQQQRRRRREQQDLTRVTTATTSTVSETVINATKASAEEEEIADPEIRERVRYAVRVADAVRDRHAWFADLDLSTGFAAACGIQKCFYPGKRSHGTDGYLVARAREWRQMKRAHDLEKTLADGFGTERLSRSIELVSGITREMAWVLKHYTRQWGYPDQEQIFSSRHTDQIVLQRVRAAPRPHLMVAFTPRKGRSMLMRLPAFREQITDPAAFTKQFSLEHRRILRIVKKYSRLSDDFQFILDATGRVYHVDLDRNGGTEDITDEAELREELEWIDGDLRWLLQQIIPPAPEEPRQRCRHSFCKTKKATRVS